MYISIFNGQFCWKGLLMKAGLASATCNVHNLHWHFFSPTLAVLLGLGA
jgi:hypothetical protein